LYESSYIFGGLLRIAAEGNDRKTPGALPDRPALAVAAPRLHRSLKTSVAPAKDKNEQGKVLHKVLYVSKSEDKYMTPLKHTRVLYAEDDEDSRFMVTTMLGFADIDVTTARTIAEAWELGLIGNFDLYLLDSRFPDGSGLELCRRLRERDPQTPVVFYSGDVYEKDVRNGLDAGARAYLPKPYLHDLGETILKNIYRHPTPLADCNVSLHQARQT
jgi:CheY-like chemotaxis protein